MTAEQHGRFEIKVEWGGIVIVKIAGYPSENRSFVVGMATDSPVCESRRVFCESHRLAGLNN